MLVNDHFVIHFTNCLRDYFVYHDHMFSLYKAVFSLFCCTAAAGFLSAAFTLCLLFENQMAR